MCAFICIGNRTTGVSLSVIATKMHGFLSIGNGMNRASKLANYCSSIIERTWLSNVRKPIGNRTSIATKYVDVSPLVMYVFVSVSTAIQC